MVKQTYSEKLRDPRWQKKRLEILQRDNFTCQLCSDEKSELHIHHKKYMKGREPWEYEDDNFMSLCKHCHAVMETYKDSEMNQVVACKFINHLGTGVFINSITNHETFGLILTVDRYNIDGTVDFICALRRDIVLKIADLFQHSEKLIPYAKQNTKGLD